MFHQPKGVNLVTTLMGATEIRRLLFRLEAAVPCDDLKTVLKLAEGFWGYLWPGAAAVFAEGCACRRPWWQATGASPAAIRGDIGLLIASNLLQSDWGLAPSQRCCLAAKWMTWRC